MDEFRQFTPGQADFTAVPIEKVAQYWDQRPCNLRHSLAPVGTREYFDQVEERKYRVEPHIPHFANFAQWSGKRVLEIGAGLGTESINFARAGAELTVVDISLESLNLAKKRFEVYGLEAVFVHANAEELASVLGPDRAGYYDLVWSFGVIHHTPHPARAIDSIRTLLKPGGELRIMVYSKISYKLFFLMRETGQWDFSKVDSIISTFSEAQTGCPVTYSYTFSDIRNHLLKDGFRITELRKTHIFCWDIDAYRQYRYEKEACWRDVSDEDFARFEEELGWHTLVSATRV